MVHGAVVVLDLPLSNDLHLAVQLHEALVRAVAALQELVDLDGVQVDRRAQLRVVHHLELFRAVVRLDVATETDLKFVALSQEERGAIIGTEIEAVRIQLSHQPLGAGGVDNVKGYVTQVFTSVTKVKLRMVYNSCVITPNRLDCT